MTTPETHESTLYHILIVCTSTESSSWNTKTGLWLDELTEPYYIFKDVGYTIDICSIKGGKVPLDPACLVSDYHSEQSQNFLNDHLNLLENTESLDSIAQRGELSKYSCIFLCGGHGCIDDFYDNSTLTNAVEMIYNNNRGCVGAICHGTIGLAYANSNGKRIIDGKFIATFTNEEERELRLDGTLPVLCESILDREGAICIPSPPWKPTAVVDGRVVTGQNPQSSTETALRILDVLRSLGNKYSAPLNVNKPWGK